MDDLIYRDDLYNKLREEHDGHKAIWELNHHDAEQGGICLGLSYAILMLSKQKTIEAVPVRHGQWIFVGEETMPDGWTYRKHKCSECNFVTVEAKNFCQNCGVKMNEDNYNG